MITRITEPEARTLIGEAVAQEVDADTEWFRHFYYELSDGRLVEYTLDVNDDGKVDEHWDLIDIGPTPRNRSNA